MTVAVTVLTATGTGVVGGVLTPFVGEDSIRITQLADSHVFVAEFDVTDQESDIVIPTGAHLAAKVATIVDGATTFFGGYVANQDIEGWEIGSRILHVQCQGYGIRLVEVLVEFEDYSGVVLSDAEIIDDLFDTYLATVDSVTHVATLVPRLWISFTEMSLSEIMDAICERSGGRWYIDNLNMLHYFADENSDCGFDLSDTPDQVTSFSYSAATIKKVDGSRIINSVRVIGADGFGTTREDAGSIAAYGSRAAIITDQSLTTTEQLEERGDAVLTKNDLPLTTYTLQTRHAGAVAGDEVDYKNVVLGLAALTTQTIRELYIVWEQGTPMYEMTLGEAETRSLDRAGHTEARIRSLTTNPVLPLGARGWSHNIVFSATDNDTVAWAAGTIITAGGVGAFVVEAGNTGNMPADRYVYLDTDIEPIPPADYVLQVTASAVDCVGLNKILIAVCGLEVAGKDASLKVFNGQATGLVVGNMIVANAIKAGHIDVAQLDAISANMGLLTAGEVRVGVDTVGVDFTGYRIYADYLASYIDDVRQFYISAADGKAYAGAGAVLLDADGVAIAEGTGDTNSIRWVTAAPVTVGSLFMEQDAGDHLVWLEARNVATNLDNAWVTIQAFPHTDYGANPSQIQVISKAADYAGRILVKPENTLVMSVDKDFIGLLKPVQGAAGDFHIRLGDAAGAKAVLIQKSTAALAAGIGSNGNAWFAGELTAYRIATDGANTNGSQFWEMGGRQPSGDFLMNGYIEVWINGSKWLIGCATG